jgi:putative transposase
LIFRMVVENPTWGAPRIHGELLTLSFEVSERTVSRWMKRAPRDPGSSFGSAPRFLIFDHDAKYGLEVPTAVRSLSVSPVRTSFESPWQNGVAERWVGSCRRDLLDHIIAIDERHLKRLLSEYIRYYHKDRRHLGLGKGTPDGRPRTIASARRPFSCATGRAAPPVRSGRLNPNQRRVAKTSGFPHRLYIQVHRAGVPPERILALGG